MRNVPVHPLIGETPPTLRHDVLERVLVETDDLLVVQDLDGVCMGLVRDPLTRTLDPDYVRAVPAFGEHFYVLTNGEHVGRRGVNRIVERAVGAELAAREGLYLPGLGAGGVQWQDRFGKLEYPGVRDEELSFLAEVPARIAERLRGFLSERGVALEDEDAAVASTVLENPASPTANLNSLHPHLREDDFRALQLAMVELLEQLIAEAAGRGMADSFFIHLAPNLGRGPDGRELLRPAEAGDSGTTDVQLMLRGAVKELGVLALLNRYLGMRSGEYPLGEGFSARGAPRDPDALAELVERCIPVDAMPLLVGIGDTVTSRVDERDGERVVRRGGSDRGFLELVQQLGARGGGRSLVVYVDSSGGELSNRTPVRVERGADGRERIVSGPGDARDRDDPLHLDIVLPGGHQQYTALFVRAARLRLERRQ